MSGFTGRGNLLTAAASGRVIDIWGALALNSDIELAWPTHCSYIDFVIRFLRAAKVRWQRRHLISCATIVSAFESVYSAVRLEP